MESGSLNGEFEVLIRLMHEYTQVFFFFSCFFSFFFSFLFLYGQNKLLVSLSWFCDCCF